MPAKPSYVVLPAQSESATVAAYFIERFANIPAAQWQARFRAHQVCDSHGQPIAIEASFAQYARQKLSYFRAVDLEPEIPFAESIVFEDEFIVIADKPHFLPVLPAGQYLQQTLLSRLQHRLGNPHLAPAHRIDQATAGLVLFTKSAAHRGAYQKLFRDRAIKKTYQAIAPFQAELKLPMNYRSRLVEAAHFMQMMEVEGEANSETEIALLSAIDGHWGHYQLRPKTGKRHQLRAQMNALGLPIRNDALYPVLRPQEQSLDFNNPLQLLAQALEFVDPITNFPRSFESGFRLKHAPA